MLLHLCFNLSPFSINLQSFAFFYQKYVKTHFLRNPGYIGIVAFF